MAWRGSDVVLKVEQAAGACEAHAKADVGPSSSYYQSPNRAHRRDSTKMLGINYESSDDEDVIPASKQDVRLANVFEGLR